jgi:hypothetical protein
MKQTGDFTLGPLMWDADLDCWYIRMGVVTKKGMTLHYTIHGKTPERTEEMAEKLCRLLTVLRPDDLKLRYGAATDRLIDDILNTPD